MPKHYHGFMICREHGPSPKFGLYDTLDNFNEDVKDFLSRIVERGKPETIFKYEILSEFEGHLELEWTVNQGELHKGYIDYLICEMPKSVCTLVSMVEGFIDSDQMREMVERISTEAAKINDSPNKKSWLN